MVIKEVDEARRVWKDMIRDLVDASQSLDDRGESRMRQVIDRMERDVEDAFERMLEIADEHSE